MTTKQKTNVMALCKYMKGCSALGQLFNRNHLFAADLFCCTVWLLFSFHFYFVSYRWTMLPFLVGLVRLAVSVDLFRRRKLTAFPILLLLIVGVCDMISVFNYFAPTGISFLYMADYFSQCVDFEMYYWPLHDIFANSNLGKTIFCIILTGWMWVAVVPTIAYGIMAYRKTLRKADGEWKGWLLWFSAIIVATIIMISMSNIPWPYRIATRFAHILLIFTIPLLAWKRYRILRDPVWKRYGAFLIVLALAYISGYTMNRIAALICVPLTSATFYWLVNKCVKRKHVAHELYLIVYGAGFFVLATYTLGWIKIATLSFSSIIIGWMCWKFFRSTHRPILSLLTFIVCAIIMPSITIGYNQYRAWNTRGLWLCNEADDISTGVLYVVDEHEGYGLRDRYGLIVPPYSEELSSKITCIPPLNHHYTYFCVNSEDGTYIVDIRTKMGKPVTKENTKLIPIGERSYKAVKRTCIDKEPWHTDSICAYVLLPHGSYRYDQIVVSDHPLDENIDNEYYIACEQQPVGALKFCSLFAKENAAQMVANRLSYPIYRPYPIPAIKDASDFLSQYDIIFDNQLREVLINSKAEDWKVYESGFNCYACRMDTLGRRIVYNTGRISITGLSEEEMPRQESLRKQEIATLPAAYREDKWIPEACYVSADEDWIVRVDSDKTFEEGTNAYPFRVMLYKANRKLTGEPQHTFYVTKCYDNDAATNYFRSIGEGHNFYMKMDNLYDGWEYREMYMDIAGETPITTTLELANWIELLHKSRN